MPSSKSYFGNLRDWAQYNPHQLGTLRLVLFTIGLLTAGLLGTRWATPVLPTVYNAAAQCTFGAERYAPPPYAMYAIVSQTFSIQWTIENTGSCRTWNNDVFFARRNDDILSVVNAYPVSSQPIVTATANASPMVVAFVMTEMIAPATPGEYVTEWDLRTPDGRRFGPVMRQRVQVVPVGSVIPQLIPNEPPSPYFFIGGMLSIIYHLLPALLGVIFVLWRANDFLNRSFNLPDIGSGLAHVTALMFGNTSTVLTVNQGKLDPEMSSESVQAIGGPAWLAVEESNAVLLERGIGFSRIVGFGYHRLRPHERVRGIVDLRSQQRRIRKKALTTDGIPLILDLDLKFRIGEFHVVGDAFQLLPPPPLGPIDSLRKQFGLTLQRDPLTIAIPSRFSREAVRHAVYETPVSKLDWAGTFVNDCAESLANHLSNMRLDQLMASRDPTRTSADSDSDMVSEIAQRIAAARGIELFEMTNSIYEYSTTDGNVEESEKPSENVANDSTSVTRTGGADLNADSIEIGGDVVGRDKIVQIYYTHITFGVIEPEKIVEGRIQSANDDSEQALLP